ncbi:MAG: DedA family protein [Oligoflexia bacterium]|nr:DedA family protein [Oligoflexia bacterium]
MNKFNTSVSFLLTLNPVLVYSVLFGVLILCGFGLPLPEDIVLIIGGYLAYEELLNVHIMTAVGLTGVLIGDSTIFFLGRRFGPVLLKHKYISRLVTEEKISKAQKYMHKYGNRIFFIARFLPGLRSPVFFTGGSLQTRFHIFFLYDGFAAIISVPVWVYSAYYGGEYIYKVIQVGRNAQTFIIASILLVIIIKIYFHYRSVAKKKIEKNKLETKRGVER